MAGQPSLNPRRPPPHSASSLVLKLQPPAALREQLSRALSRDLLSPRLGWGPPPSDWQPAAAGGVPGAESSWEEGGGGAAGDGGCFDAVWRAVLRVWASQWGAGAAAALAAAGLARARLRMGVLLQPVAPLCYAFVAHTHRYGLGPGWVPPA
jgi:hypothetical protein